jgi:hypothetical protein
MTKKANFELDKALNRIANPSPFDKIVKEIDAKEIPSKYIEHMMIFYFDGSIVELNGSEITKPIPMKRDTSWEDMESSFRKMKDVKVFINTSKLEKDINMLVEDYLGKYC